VGGLRKGVAWSHSIDFVALKTAGPNHLREMDTSPDHAEAARDQDHEGWSPMDWLRSLGRAASIAAGDVGQEHTEFHCFRIAVTGRTGAYYARVTHYLGKAIRMPAPVKRQLDARFPNPEQAVQHARFMITSGALKPVQRG